MKRSPIRKVSQKQEVELAKREALKHQLWEEQEGKCKVCGKFLKWNEAELSHTHGRETTRENCDVRCRWWLAGCHSNIEHGRNNKYNEQPIWSKE